MAVGPVQLLVLGFDNPEHHWAIASPGGMIAPYDLLASGLASAEEAKQLRAQDRSAAVSPA